LHLERLTNKPIRHQFFMSIERATGKLTISLSQGKVAELRAELADVRKDKGYVRKKTTLKKIVANMTMSNNDMAALFPDVIACMGIPVLEIKKMCFLFLVNYGRMDPDKALKSLPILLNVSISADWRLW
jgi:vesicle coat complex subunit